MHTADFNFSIFLHLLVYLFLIVCNDIEFVLEFTDRTEGAYMLSLIHILK